MKRTGALAITLVSCAGAPSELAAPAVDAPSASASSVASDTATAPPPSPAPPPVVEIVYEGAARERLARLALLARGVFDAYENRSPQPVIRGYTEVPYVQFRTDRRERGVLTWVEAATMSLHHVVERATKVEPCAHPLAPGDHVRVRGGEARLVRTRDHDELRFGTEAHPVIAKLPRGAAHEACVGPDETRVWVAWSTPLSPAELFSVSAKDGSVRPLRIDARPGLAPLGDVKATTLELGDGAAAATLEPTGGALATALLVDEDDAPLARWNPLARLLAGVGARVIVAKRADVARAATKGTKVTAVVHGARGGFPGLPTLALIDEGVTGEATIEATTTLVVAGDPLADAARSSAGRTGARLTIAPGNTPREALPGAWARIADGVLDPR